MRVCEICGKVNLDEDKFCGECGSKLSEPADYCPDCNLTYSNLNKFCTQCGTKLVVKSQYLKTKSLNKNRNINQSSHNQNININKHTYYSHNKNINSNNLKKSKTPAPPDTFLSDLIKNTKVHEKIHRKDSVFIEEEKENSSDYADVSDYELIRLYEIAYDDLYKARTSEDNSNILFAKKRYNELKAEMGKRSLY